MLLDTLQSALHPDRRGFMLLDAAARNVNALHHGPTDGIDMRVDRDSSLGRSASHPPLDRWDSLESLDGSLGQVPKHGPALIATGSCGPCSTYVCDIACTPPLLAHAHTCCGLDVAARAKGAVHVKSDSFWT